MRMRKWLPCKYGSKGHTYCTTGSNLPLQPIQGVTAAPTSTLLASVSTVKAFWASGLAKSGALVRLELHGLCAEGDACPRHSVTVVCRVAVSTHVGESGLQRLRCENPRKA